MSTLLRLYKVFCEHVDHMNFQYTWAESAPTGCPTTPAHTSIRSVSEIAKLPAITIDSTHSPYNASQKCVVADTSAASVTVNLPPLNRSKLAIYLVVKKFAANTLTLQAHGAELVDASNTATLTAEGACLLVMNTGSLWETKAVNDQVTRNVFNFMPLTWEKGSILVDSGFETAAMAKGPDGFVLGCDSNEANGLGYVQLTKNSVGLGNLENLKVKLDATSAPTATDDSSAGYSVGSRWVDVAAKETYECVDATPSAAEWKVSTSVTASTSDVAEGTNLYYTEARVSANADVAAASAHSALTTNPHSVTKSQVGLGNVPNLKHKLNAVAPPTATDDSGSGYAAGSVWVDVNSNLVYLCTSAAASSAVWKHATAATTSQIAEGTNLYYSEARVSSNADVAAATTHAARTDNPHAVSKSQLGLANVANTKNNFAASVAPTASNDAGEGYTVGSVWIDTSAGSSYVCTDATGSAAVWMATCNVGNTDSLPEGSTNLYFSDARADARIAAQKGSANGLATLDGSGKVPASQLEVADVSYMGTWNANTNTPTLTSSVGGKGYYYVIDTDGATELDGITDWMTGDWAIFNGTVWQKVDNSDKVASVAGKIGAVTLVSADVTDLSTSTVPEGSNLYFTDARVAANASVTSHSNHVANTSSNPHSVTKAQVGLADVENLKTNLNASAAPGASDDAGAGYSVGSKWVDTSAQNVYECVDSTASSAVWLKTSYGGATWVFAEEKPAGTNAGTFSSGAWQTRALNTQQHAHNGSLSLASNQITVAAGTYKVDAFATARNVDSNQLRLHNVTDDAALAYGIAVKPEISDSALSSLHAVVTLATQKTLELQHRCTTTAENDGFGIAAGWGTEVFSQVIFTRLS